MGIDEKRNLDTDEILTPRPGGSSAGCNCNCNSTDNMQKMMRQEAQQLLGQLSKMLPQLERSLG